VSFLGNYPFIYCPQKNVFVKITVILEACFRYIIKKEVIATFYLTILTFFLRIA